MVNLTEAQNETDSPDSALWPCPDCAGELREKRVGRIDYVLKCDRCGWEKLLARSIPVKKTWDRPHLRPTRRSYDG